MSKTNPPLVELDELLAAEYDYIAQTATQANEDRARVSSFYLIAVGSLVAALFGTQLFDAVQIYADGQDHVQRALRTFDDAGHIHDHAIGAPAFCVV